VDDVREFGFQLRDYSPKHAFERGTVHFRSPPRQCAVSSRTLPRKRSLRSAATSRGPFQTYVQQELSSLGSSEAQPGRASRSEVSRSGAVSVCIAGTTSKGVVS